MSRIFFTYVWGPFGEKGAPLTFTSKANRTMAQHSTEVGDIAFGVVSRNPANPGVIIPEELKGRVVSAWQVSHASADTAQYELGSTKDWDRDESGSYRWPFALQPIRTWKLRDAPEFRELDGYGPGTHTQRAITTLQLVEQDELAASLRDLLVTQGEEVEVMMPRFQAMVAQVQVLRQKHPFALKGYTVTPNADALNHIYIATLGSKRRTLKIGHAQDAAARVESFNSYRLSSEPQWRLHTYQPIGTVQQAIEVEKRLGEIFAKHRTEPNNGEVFVDLDPDTVLARIGTMDLKR